MPKSTPSHASQTFSSISGKAARLIPTRLTVACLLFASFAIPIQAQTIRWKPSERVQCVREAQGVTITKTVELVGPMPNRVGVSFWITDLPATYGDDYTGQRFGDLFLSFSESNRTDEVRITLLDDALEENSEAINLHLDAYDGVTLEGPSKAMIKIVDDDSAGDINRCLDQENFDDLYFQTNATITRWTSTARRAPFELKLTNYGTAARHNIEFSQIIPAFTRFDPANSSPGWQCPTGDGENRTCSISIGSLASGAEASAQFATRVHDSTQRSIDIYSAASVQRTSNISDIRTTSGLAQRAINSLNTVIGALLPFDFCPACTAEERLSGQFSEADLKCIKLLNALHYAGTQEPNHNTARRGLLGSISRLATLGYNAGILYRLRDRVLRTQPGGRRALDLFYDNVGTMYQAAERSPGYYFTAAGYANRWMPALFNLVYQDGSAPVTQSMADGFTDFFEDLYPYTPASFDALARAQLARLDPDSWVGRPVSAAIDSLAKLSCEANDETLCLNEGRFRVEVEWKDFQGGVARGRADQLTEDTGSFWFFDDANLELIVKVLDAQGVNGHYWVFYGSLSNVEYSLTVTDTLTGNVRNYSNPAGIFASEGDTVAFATDLGSANSDPRPFEPASAHDRRRSGELRSKLASSQLTELVSGRGDAFTTQCTPDTTTLCLEGGRFAVSVDFRDFQGGGGDGQSIDLTADTGAFWFFDEANVELVVKVLDARGVNGHFWVFYGALSNVEYTLTVTDTLTGRQNVYYNPAGTFASNGDAVAFLD